MLPAHQAIETVVGEGFLAVIYFPEVAVIVPGVAVDAVICYLVAVALESVGVGAGAPGFLAAVTVGVVVVVVTLGTGVRVIVQFPGQAARIVILIAVVTGATAGNPGDAIGGIILVNLAKVGRVDLGTETFTVDDLGPAAQFSGCGRPGIAGAVRAVTDAAHFAQAPGTGVVGEFDGFGAVLRMGDRNSRRP